MDQLERGLGQLGFRSRGKLRLDDISGDHHRPHPPPARAANISRLQAMLRSHQPDDRAMLAVAAKRADDGWGGDLHGSAPPHERSSWGG